MGAQKLLLPWGDGLLIDRVLQAWSDSTVSTVIVVVRRDDQPLQEACRQHSVRVVHPMTDPVDMKASVQFGLRTIQRELDPSRFDRCFIAPADLPTLTADLIDQLAATEFDSDSVVIPRFGRKQGHPVLIPWIMTPEIFELSGDQGVDAMIGRHTQRFVQFNADDRVRDIDTPEDYQRRYVQHHQNRAPGIDRDASI